MHTVILAAGSAPRSQRTLRLLAEADFVACCDGAAAVCQSEGRPPDIIVGDGDSIDPSLRQLWADRFVHIAEQETNDLTKTFKHCLALGHRNIDILGATGRREDHTMGNIALLMDYAEWLPVPFGQLPAVRMVSDYGTFYPCRDQLRLSVEEGCEVSVFSFGAKRFSAVGLRYPLYDFSRLWQGTLNVATQRDIRIDAEGAFLVYVAEKM